MKKIVFGILFVLLLVSVFMGAFDIQSAKANTSSRGEIAQAADPDWWPMFHHDLNHTGISTLPAPLTNHTQWTYTTTAFGGAVQSSPAVVGDLVYVASNDSNVYCLNATTGRFVWNYTTRAPVVSSPAVVGGFVFVGSVGVYCLNAATGARVWNNRAAGYVESSPAVVNGLVYAGSYEGNVTCLNAATGDFVWNYTTGNQVMSSPAVVGGYVYVGSMDGNVYCLQATSGALIWNEYLSGYKGVVSSPAVVGGLVYVGCGNGDVYCLNAASGSPVWVYATSGSVESSPAVVNGLVYVGSDDDNVYCLNATTVPLANRLVWSQKTGGMVRSSPAVVGGGGLVFVGSDDGNVYCLNGLPVPLDNRLIWSYTTGGWVISSPAVVNGVVYVGSAFMGGKVYAFGAGTATLQGENVVVTSASGVSLKFASVTSDGVTTVTEAQTGPSPPYGFELATSPPTYYSIETTASYTGIIQLVVPFNGAGLSKGAKSHLRLLHYDATSQRWTDVTTWVDTDNNVIYGETTSFSMFSITSTGGLAGVTGYKLVFNQTMNNSLSLPLVINYHWSFSIDKWNGAQWVATGISGSTTPVVGYVIPALTTVDLPYYVYLLPSSGSRAVAWGDWVRINYTFNCTYNNTNYSTDHIAQLHVHPADISGAASVTFPYLGADGNVATADLHVLGVQWGLSSVGADPTSDLGRADINGDGNVGTADLHILGVQWGQTWTNTPP